MRQINERPNILGVFDVDRGYLARTLCVVDGMPAQVHIRVNTKTPEYSEFDIRVYDPLHGCWNTVFEMDPAEVGHMPVYGSTPEALAELNKVAANMWEVATTVVPMARARQDLLDAEAHLLRRRMVRDVEAQEFAEASRALQENAAPTDPFYNRQAPMRSGGDLAAFYRRNPAQSTDDPHDPDTTVLGMPVGEEAQG